MRPSDSRILEVVMAAGKNLPWKSYEYRSIGASSVAMVSYEKQKIEEVLPGMETRKKRVLKPRK